MASQDPIASSMPTKTSREESGAAGANPSGSPIAISESLSGSKLSVIEKVGYGLGDTASNLYWKTFETFLMYFYTDVFGLAAKSAGTMMLVTGIWDAVNDPIVGYIADRTKTAWGRFRPYLLWMAIPLAITGVLTFYTPDLGPNGKLVYAYVTYTLVMMAYTAINIPYGALMGVISPSSLERTSVSTYRFVAAFCGGIVVQYGTLHLVQVFGGGVEKVIVDGVAREVVVDEQAGFFWTMVVFSIAAVILFWITFATTKERVEPELHQNSTLKQDLSDLLANRPWLILLSFGLLQLMGLFVRGGAVIYYFKYFWNDKDLVPMFLVAGSFCAILGMLLTKALTSVFGKKWLMITMNVSVAFLTAAFCFLDPDQFWLMISIHIIASFIGGPSPVLLWAMYADTADYSEWRTHRRATGMVFAAATFSQKIGCAVGIAMTGFLLDLYEYSAPVDGIEQVQSPATLNGLRMMMSLIPATFFLLAACCLLFYNISDPVLRQIESELAIRKSPGRAIDSPTSRDLTSSPDRMDHPDSPNTGQ